MIEIQTLREPWEVDSRLAQMGLGKKTLLECVSVAVSAAADVTPFHAANAAGTFSYQHGTWALRDRHAGTDWVLDRTESVEAIKNERLKIRIIFSNVDIACSDDQKPKPRSRKGAGSERVCIGNLFGDNLPEYAPNQPDGWATYYLMVDERGASELTRPVVKGGTFTAWIERIYLSDGSDLEIDILDLDDGVRADEFDPLVARK